MQRRIVNLHIQVFLLDIVFEEVVLVCDRDVPVAQDCDRGGGVVRVRVIADEEVAPGEVPRGIIRPRDDGVAVLVDVGAVRPDHQVSAIRLRGDIGIALEIVAEGRSSRVDQVDLRFVFPKSRGAGHGVLRSKGRRHAIENARPVVRQPARRASAVRARLYRRSTGARINQMAESRKIRGW
jgi:hypothetical protein